MEGKAGKRTDEYFRPLGEGKRAMPGEILELHSSVVNYGQSRMSLSTSRVGRLMYTRYFGDLKDRT